jgi:hypothetical protein
MKMIFECLVPSVQYGDDPDGPLKASLAKLQQRFTDGFKEEAEHNFLVGEDQPIQFMGQGEDDMEISHR